MKIISHRGNIKGPVLEKENRPSYIDAAIGLGYDVEVDVRFIDGSFWFGHDEPQYKVSFEWINLRKDKIWFHCKDLYSSIELIKHGDKFKFFCHSRDNFVLVSNKKIWVHDLTKIIDENCVIPLISLEDIDGYDNKIPYAVCTDFVNEVKKIDYDKNK